MIEYMKFWFAEFLTGLSLGIGIPLFFILLICALEGLSRLSAKVRGEK